MKQFKSKLTGRTILTQDQCFYCKYVGTCFFCMAAFPPYKCPNFDEDTERSVAGPGINNEKEITK